MGGGSYNLESRNLRAKASNFSDATRDSSTVFKQAIERKAHDSMLSKGVKIRESRDSEAHPASVPIILAMDVTGSMESLPVDMVTVGLPKIMAKLLERGVDPALLFTAIGDHEWDKYPLQIGQFESGDAELDMWLTRTFIEKGGGGNGGESYLLAWYMAAYIAQTDAWDKRKEKGFLITIGDEPCLPNLPGSAVTGIFGENVGEKANYTREKLLAKAQERWHVFHINIEHASVSINAQAGWIKLLGENAMSVQGVSDIANVIVDKISTFKKNTATSTDGFTGQLQKEPTPSPEGENTATTVPQML